MTKPARSFLLLAATALALTACGNSNSSQNAAKSQLRAIESAIAQGANASGGATSSGSGATSDSPTSSDSSTSSASGTGTSTVDVCALLSQADANSVALDDKLDSAQTASTVYTLEATELPTVDGEPECSFEINNPGAFTREGTFEVNIEDASNIGNYSPGAKINGLGDEAFITGNSGDIVVRVGSQLLFAQNENDAIPDATLADLLGKMIPHLK